MGILGFLPNAVKYKTYIFFNVITNIKITII